MSWEPGWMASNPKSLGEPMRAWCLVLRFEESNPQSSEKPWIEIGLLRYLNALGFQPWLNFFHSCQFVLLLFRSYLFVVAGFVDIFFSVWSLSCNEVPSCLWFVWHLPGWWIHLCGDIVQHQAFPRARDFGCRATPKPQVLRLATEGDLFHWVEHLCISPGPDREWALAFREFKSHWWDMMKSWPRAAWLRRDSAHDAAAVLWHEMCQFSLILSATYNICGLTNQKGSLSWRKPWPSLDYCRIVSICFHSAFHLRYDHLNGTIKHPCTSWKDLLSISLDSAVQWWDV